MFEVFGKVWEWIESKLLTLVRRMTWRAVLASTVIGVTGGVFPVPLANTPVTVALCNFVKFNTAQYAIASTVSLLAMPLQLMLIPVFAQLLAVVTRHDAASVTRVPVSSLQAGGLGELLQSSGKLLLYSAAGWCLVAPPVILAVRAYQKIVKDK